MDWKFKNERKEVRGMVLMMITMWYPSNKSTEVTKKYFEVMKKFPLASFEKALVSAVKPDKEGVQIIGIAEIGKEKYEEAFNLNYKRMVEFHSIEGCEYKIETLVTFEESFALRGIVPPK
jgi:predicted transcriptional regulator